MRIVENINGIHVNIKFTSGINCIDLGISGSGKTFLMTLIEAYCVKNSIECRFFNYNTRGEDIKTILNNIEDRDSVVLLDNADLYMSDEISNLMHKYKNVTFIISIKRRLRLGEPYKLFRLSYNDLSLSCEEVNI